MDENMEEADFILELLKRGEKRGLELLFKKFYAPLVVYAYKFLKNKEEAEDAVQEVFIGFWRRNQFLMIEYLRSYLYQSVRNYCLNKLEENKGRISEGIEKLSDLPEEPALEDDSRFQYLDEIYKEIELLPEKTRKVFKAIILEGKKYKEVAEEENISINTVKTFMARALSTLRNRFKGTAFILFFTALLKKD